MAPRHPAKTVDVVDGVDDSQKGRGKPTRRDQEKHRNRRVGIISENPGRPAIKRLPGDSFCLVALFWHYLIKSLSFWTASEAVSW